MKLLLTDFEIPQTIKLLLISNPGGRLFCVHKGLVEEWGTKSIVVFKDGAGKGFPDVPPFFLVGGRKEQHSCYLGAHFEKVSW